MNVAQGKAASAATLGYRGQNNLGACGACDGEWLMVNCEMCLKGNAKVAERNPAKIAEVCISNFKFQI